MTQKFENDNENNNTIRELDVDRVGKTEQLGNWITI